MTDDTKIAFQNILQNLKVVYRAEFPDLDIKTIEKAAEDQVKTFLIAFQLGKETYQHRDEIKGLSEKMAAEGKKHSPAKFGKQILEMIDVIKKLKETIKID